MAASDFEYRQPFWILLGIYLAAFACWPLDRSDVSGVLTRLFPATALGAGLGFLIAAVVVAFAAGLFTWSSGYGQQLFATWLCWVAFGLLLNRLGFFIVVVGMTVFLYRLRRREKAYPVARTSKGSWSGGLPVWIAAAALLTLALTLKESLFFLVLAVALLSRILRGSGLRA